MSESDEGLTLETSASESLYGGQFTLSTQLIKPNYLVILPPTQHHSFFRNLPPLFIRKKVPYEGRTRQSDRAGKMRTALLEMRTAPAKTMQNNFVAKMCFLENE